METQLPIIDQSLLHSMTNYQQIPADVDLDDEYYPKMCKHGEFPDDCPFCPDD